MKTKKKILPLLLSASILFTGCSLFSSGADGPHPLVDGMPDRFTQESEKILVFEQGSSSSFWARDDHSNGYPFNCSFQRSNALIEDGLLTLSLTKTNNGYAGAEYRSTGNFSYGFYSVSMKAAKCSGVISSFFTYTNRPWDEIDIEFLGDDTTKIQLNYYTSGIGGHEYIYKLGFDGAEDFHEYAFDWQPDSITWYVDGKPIYKAVKDIPSTSGKIMMNVWNVHDSVAYWAGKFDETKLPVSAQYQWIGYKSAD